MSYVSTYHPNSLILQRTAILNNKKITKYKHMRTRQTIINHAAVAALTLTAATAVAQTAGAESFSVTTEPTAKNILLEEYTGIHCGYCPQGHALAATLHQATPRAFIVAIHAGGFASPGRDEPDFRTEDGTALNNAFGISSYPSGMVNRHTPEGGTPQLMGRSEWIPLAKTEAAATATVNLLAESTYDGDTRRMTVHVEGCFTAEEQPEEQELCVAWTQDNITGPQNGANMGDSYVHQHMLRGFITPVWGDALETPAKGKYFARDYAVTLPEYINGVSVKAEDVNVVAFVVNGRGNVLNVTGGKPCYVNCDTPAGAVIQKPRVPIGAAYGYNFFELTMANKSDKAVTVASFDIDVNGTVYKATWTGSVPPFGEKEISVKCDYAMKANGNNDYSITLTAINGENVTAEPLTGSFGSPIEATPGIKLSIKTNYEASENTFTIRDADGNVVREFGPYADGSAATYEETADLEAGKVYCLEITDQWGDGIYSPRGYVTAHSSDGSIIEQIYSIDGFGTRCFFRTSKIPSAISMLTTDKARPVDVYRADGTLAGRALTTTSGLPRGLYIVRDTRSGQAAKIAIRR